MHCFVFVDQWQPCAPSGIFVFLVVPETKGRTLAEIQHILGSSVTGLRPAASVPGPPDASPFAGPSVADSSGTPTPKGRRGTGPLSGQSSGQVEHDRQGPGVVAWWRRTSEVVQHKLLQSMPRMLLRRRFDRMPEGCGVVPQA